MYKRYSDHVQLNLGSLLLSIPRPVIVFPAPAEVAMQLDLNNFDRRPRPLIDRYTRLVLLQLLLHFGFKDFQVSVSWLFTADITNTLHGTARVTNSPKKVYGFQNLWISSKDFTDFS